MTTEEIKQKIQHLREIAGDDEAAHVAEDALREDFIRYVASLDETVPRLAAQAKLILTTKDIQFERWCA